MLNQIDSRARLFPRRSEKSRVRAAARDVVVAASSVGVLSLLVLYAVAAPTAKLTASFGPVVPRPGVTAVVQGRVLEAGGGGLGGAQIVARAPGGPATTVRSRHDGTFRIDLRGTCASYEISIRADAAGSTVDAATRRPLCPGDALPVDARVVTQGHFLWVPGPR